MRRVQALGLIQELGLCLLPHLLPDSLCTGFCGKPVSRGGISIFLCCPARFALRIHVVVVGTEYFESMGVEAYLGTSSGDAVRRDSHFGIQSHFHRVEYSWSRTYPLGSDLPPRVVQYYDRGSCACTGGTIPLDSPSLICWREHGLYWFMLLASLLVQHHGLRNILRLPADSRFFRGDETSRGVPNVY